MQMYLWTVKVCKFVVFIATYLQTHGTVARDAALHTARDAAVLPGVVPPFERAHSSVVCESVDE